MRQFANRFRDLQSDFLLKKNKLDSLCSAFTYFWEYSKDYLLKLKTIKGKAREQITSNSPDKLWFGLLEETVKYLYVNMNDPEDLVTNTLNIIRINTSALLDELGKTDSKMENILKEAEELENKIEDSEKTFFNYCREVEKALLNNPSDKIEKDKKDKFQENIKLYQMNYIQAVDQFNKKIDGWNTGITQCLVVYKRHGSGTYPMLVNKLLTEFGKMQNLIFKMGNHKDFSLAIGKIKALFQVEYNIIPFIFTKKEPKMYKLSTDVVVKSSDCKANFYNKKIHDVILILKEAMPNFMLDYKGTMEEDKVFIVDTWRQISGIDETEFDDVNEILNLKDQIVDLLSQEDNTVHFLEYLNLKRGNTTSLLESHAFILMGILFMKMAEVGYNEETGKMNVLILRKLFIMSQTYCCKFKYQQKIYLIRFLESVDSFKKINFWKAYCFKFLEDEKRQIQNLEGTDYQKRLSNAVYSKLIGMVQIMSEFTISKNEIINISVDVLNKFGVDENSQKEIINFITSFNSGEKKEPFIVADLLENLKDLLEEFIESKRKNRNNEYNDNYSGSFA